MKCSGDAVRQKQWPSSASLYFLAGAV